MKDKDLSEALDSIREAMQEQKKNNQKRADEFWDNLSYDDKLAAFYSVVQRICKGELNEKGSYRYVLYDVFGFSSDAYALGMECGYLELHNSIYSFQEMQKMLSEVNSGVAGN